MIHSVGGFVGRWTRQRAVIAAVALAAALSGCVWAWDSGRLSESDKLHQQAQAALAR